jgi:hypothetical protein
VFGTLLGPLPRPPSAPDVSPEVLLQAAIDAQIDAGLEPVTDGGWSIHPHDPVASWQETTDRARGRAVKAVLAGPFTSGLRRDDDLGVLRASIAGLAAAGCPLIEIAEPGATRIGTDRDERARFRALHERLVGDAPAVHLSLAITGGSADGAGAETIHGPAYASLAVDLIAGPDNWRLVTAAPGERGIVCGVVSPTLPSDDTPEVMLWAMGYAASGHGRGEDRVGLATAASFAALTWEQALRKLERLGTAIRLAGLPVEERLAAFDPRAVDKRSAAMGRYEPGHRR